MRIGHNIDGHSSFVLLKRWLADNTRELDRSDRGSIQLRDLRPWTTNNFLKISSKELKDIFLQVDTLKQGAIGLAEFRDIYALLVEQPAVTEMCKTFSQLQSVAQWDGTSLNTAGAS